MFKFLIISLLVVACNQSSTSKNNGYVEKKRIKQIEKPSAQSTIVDHDWCYPNCQDPIAAFKFHSEGTFNYSTTMFGGMTRYGSWDDIGNNKIKLSYNDDGSTNVLDIISNSTFQIGSTIYKKN